MSLLNAAKCDCTYNRKMCWITLSYFKTIHVKRMIEDRLVTLGQFAVPQTYIQAMKFFM